MKWIHAAGKQCLVLDRKKLLLCYTIGIFLPCSTSLCGLAPTEDRSTKAFSNFLRWRTRDSFYVIACKSYAKKNPIWLEKVQTGCWLWCTTPTHPPTALPKVEFRSPHIITHTFPTLTHTYSQWTHTHSDTFNTRSNMQHTHTHTLSQSWMLTLALTHMFTGAHTPSHTVIYKQRWWMTIAEAGRTDRNQVQESWWRGF